MPSWQLKIARSKILRHASRANYWQLHHRHQAGPDHPQIASGGPELLCGYTRITKLYTKVISCLSEVLKCRLCMALTWSDLNHCRDRICTACSVGNLPSGVSCLVYFNFSHLNSTMHTKQSSLQASHTELDLRNIKVQMCSFKIFSIWPQTDRHTYIHTHVCNAVTLTWGSLRLATIM